MESLKKAFGRNADLVLVIGVVLILLILFAPIPAALLDFCLLTNFAFGLTILLLTFYVARPVDFSTFPSLLLVATLFRLSLNVAATRLILSNADAGQVIGSIGSFAVQGNFVIGLVVFFILVVVQYVVVTNGAQRVSEVAARFVLDAMPGQQMSIDADLNMGMITQDEAKLRRKDLEKEAAFYGAMDGASKFVKGDAIAGIIILLIDILGGWVVGVAQMHMSWGHALEAFTLLTIGDGIATQVPALIVSVATGIIVTRSAADRQLSAEVLRQLLFFPKIQLVVIVALTALLLLPGMPKWPMAILLPLMGGAWWVSHRNTLKAVQTPNAPVDTLHDDAVGPASPMIEVGLGRTLSEALMPTQAVVQDRISSLRQQFLTDMGLQIPPLTVRDSNRIPPSEYEVSLHGNRVAQAALHADRTLAIRSSETAEIIPGVATRDPAFGLPAIWIEASQTEKARAGGYTLIDPITVLMTHLTEIVKVHAPVLLSRTEVMRQIEGTRGRQPGLVEELIPTLISVGDVQRVMQNLLSEGVSIRNTDEIIEAMVDLARQQKDTLLLTELVRQRIGASICHGLRGNQSSLSVMTMDPLLERTISANIGAQEGATPHILEPRGAEQLVLKILATSDQMMRQRKAPVLLCAADLRRHIKSFTRRTAPRLAVISFAEVPYSIELSSFAVLSFPVTATADVDVLTVS